MEHRQQDLPELCVLPAIDNDVYTGVEHKEQVGEGRKNVTPEKMKTCFNCHNLVLVPILILILIRTRIGNRISLKRTNHILDWIVLMSPPYKVED